jgi:hypothetical protein
MTWTPTRRIVLSGVFGACIQSGDESIARAVLSELFPPEITAK